MAGGLWDTGAHPRYLRKLSQADPESLYHGPGIKVKWFEDFTLRENPNLYYGRGTNQCHRFLRFRKLIESEDYEAAKNRQATSGKWQHHRC